MNTVIDQQDTKKEKILEAAHSRFLHYGYSKTTMNEIAGDLAMSKALLYYYFPDKSQLYVEVMRKLANDYIYLLEKRSGTFVNLQEAFFYQINTKHNFVARNYNFFDFFRINEQNLPDMIWDILALIHKKEVEMLMLSLQQETDSGSIKLTKHPENLIELLLDALHGVRMCASSHKKVAFPDKEHLEDIHQKRLLLAEIFIKGLR
ncbi:hypothetical protein GCM10023149_01320 [Mucilaginibacter gynuensis]|uniref:HTH tetR-type domain-containing protein n=1 Tax=Mucilaginibacter gynuensis TaxID=1302236 RepID=A0ABP8FNB3_9SPHI